MLSLASRHDHKGLCFQRNSVKKYYLRKGFKKNYTEIDINFAIYEKYVDLLIF